jgi:lipopolysaccharide export system protein LptA
VRKYVLSLFLSLVAVTVFGQKKSIVNLVKSQSSTGIKLHGKDLIKVYQGTFKQDYSTLTSDSAYFYPQDNAFDAFGHVIINQGDTLNIYADKLNYNGNTKVAILTDNVRMVDKDATLTTNHLNYNTATRIGTYTDGGKLVNKDNTLLSKNGYYFAFSRDSYFRYNVSLTTPDALVKTDTMRYNTGSKIAYFYGPTHIYSTKGEKDKDTLYTENGTYNTGTEQAYFGKKNLYNSGTKSLKGDSLFYDKLKGYGRAVGHVTFNDREQKTTIKGGLGTYFKAEEHTIVTEDPYVIMVTEEKDTTKTDSAAKADSLIKKLPGKKRSAITMAELIKKTVPAKTDTLTVNPKLIPLKEDSLIKKPPLPDKITKTKAAAPKKTVNNSKKAANEKPGDKIKVPEKAGTVKDTSRLKRDSIYMSADTIETQILTYKDLKIYQEKQRLAHIRDTTTKAKKTKVKDSKFLTGVHLGLKTDTSYLQPDFFGKPKPVIVKKKPVKPLSKKQLALDSIAKKQQADSILMAKKAEPSDTARIRIIIAHHNFKLFKSDLQSKSDSMFYSNSDSTIRCFVNPMMWTQGSQLSGDTIYLQMKHKKLDNMTMFPSAFIVNIEKDDSVHFNQVAGKRMRGFFKDDKLSRMFIEGNAESIYFSRDSGKNTVSGMQRSLSSRIRVDFKDNKATNLAFYTKPENRYGPLDKFKEDERILKGFIWKPKERPVSKESIIPSYHKKKPAPAKPAPGKSKTGKTPLKKPPGGKAVKDSTVNAPPGKMPVLKTGKDSTVKTLPGKIPALKTGKDSTLKTDTVKTPAVKPKKDSVIVKPVTGKNPADKM